MPPMSWLCAVRRVHDPSRGEGADRARRADLAGERMHPDLDELRAEGEGELSPFGAAGHLGVPLIKLRQIASGSRPCGMDSAYSSMTLCAELLERVCERHRPNRRRRDPPVRKREVGAWPAGKRAVGARRRRRRSLSRIASQAFTTTDVVLAVVLEPPATGPAGRALSPSSTVDLVGLRPNRSAAACADDRIGAGADFVSRNRHARAPSGIRRTRAAAGAIWVG